MTELEAVNTMLISIGEQPVDGLGLEGIPEVNIAKEILKQTSRQVQSPGFTFNTEENYPLQLDVDGFIHLPPNTVKVTSLEDASIIRRGNRLYDKRKHTYVFDSPVRVDLVLALEFDELPQTARDYITVRAARIFQARVLGSEALHQFTAKDEYDAYMLLYREEIDQQDLNMFRNNSSVIQMLRR